jgi:hypothetical protein
MSRIADARQSLAQAIQALWMPERVHVVTPNRVDPPCVFLGGATLDRITSGSPGVQMAVVTFPVYCVADGRPDEQTRRLDDLLAVVWDAALSCGALPNDATPAAVDVGGPSVRGAVVRVELTLAALTLCTPSLQEATTHG